MALIDADTTQQPAPTAPWHLAKIIARDRQAVIDRHPDIVSDVRGDFFFSSRRRHTRLVSDWSSDVCSSDLEDLIARLSGGLSPADRAAFRKAAESAVASSPDCSGEGSTYRVIAKRNSPQSSGAATFIHLAKPATLAGVARKSS